MTREERFVLAATTALDSRIPFWSPEMDRAFTVYDGLQFCLAFSPAQFASRNHRCLALLLAAHMVRTGDL